MNQFDKLLKRRAFIDKYQQFKQFHDGSGSFFQEEFDSARETVRNVSEEYEACEHADYVILILSYLTY